MTFVYDKCKESWLSQSPAILIASDTIRIAIGRSSTYTPATSDQFKSSAATVQQATGPASGVTFANGVCDYNDPTFAAVPSGAALDEIVSYKDAGGADTANPLVQVQTGFSIIPNGGDITAVEDNGPNKVFKL